MTVKCCLCGNIELSLIDNINVADISKLYIHLFNVNIDMYFNGFDIISYYRCNVCNLLFYSPQAAGDEILYNNLQRIEWYYPNNRTEFALAYNYIKKNDYVLEVGCGSGFFGKMLETCNYVGLETNENAKLMAINASLNVTNQTIEDHALNNRGLYDVVCSFQVLEHVVNPDSFLKSCVDCLKPGGLLIISVPSEDSYLAIVEDGVLNMPPHHMTRWTDKTLKFVASRYQLETITLEHEKLEENHIFGFATESIRAVIKKMFCLRHKHVSTKLYHRLLTGICQILGKIYSQVILSSTIRPVGNSVTMVSRKATHR